MNDFLLSIIVFLPALGALLLMAARAPVKGANPGLDRGAKLIALLFTTLTMLVTLYAGRLGLHILFNRVIGKEEDARYRRLREEWGESESGKMLAYFLLQALAVAAFSLPFLVLMWNPRPP